MNIVITGASGFVGVNLTAYLMSCKYNVHKISLRGNSDVINLDKNADVIVHLAGKAHDLKRTAVDKDYFEVNTELTKKVFDQFLESNCEVFICLSSVKAVADTVATILDEDCIPNPVTAYGKSKLAAENYILEQKIPSNKRIYILRPCMIHGPGNKGNLNLLHKVVSSDLPWPLGDFNNKRSYLSIDNLSFVIRELLNNNQIPSGVYNVADDEALSTNEVINLIGVSLNKKKTILNIPSIYIKKIAVLGDVFKLPLNTERLQKLTESYVVDNRKIIDAIGKPFPINVSDGLVKTFKSFKND